MILETVEAHRYSIANQTLLFEAQVASLDAFEQSVASEEDEARLKQGYELLVFNRKNAKRYYEGEAKFDNADCHVTYWRRRGVSQIDINGEPVCQIDFANEHIHLLNDRSFDNRINLEVVTGPALVLLLAEQKIFCLHAGAIATPVGNVALIAESGSGKSTLSANTGGHWRQLSDDILPLQLNMQERTVELLTSFPQLKLDGASVMEPVAEPLRLDYIFRLNPEPSETVEFKEISRKDGLLQMIRHTVAARLFGQTLMNTHAKFSTRVAGRVPMIELSFPRNIMQLDQLRDAVIAYLKQRE